MRSNDGSRSKKRNNHQGRVARINQRAPCLLIHKLVPYCKLLSFIIPFWISQRVQPFYIFSGLMNKRAVNQNAQVQQLSRAHDRTERKRGGGKKKKKKNKALNLLASTFINEKEFIKDLQRADRFPLSPPPPSLFNFWFIRPFSPNFLLSQTQHLSSSWLLKWLDATIPTPLFNFFFLLLLLLAVVYSSGSLWN